MIPEKIVYTILMGKTLLSKKDRQDCGESYFPDTTVLPVPLKRHICMVPVERPRLSTQTPVTGARTDAGM